MNFLIADDNSDLLESLSMLLVNNGHSVHRETNGKAALEAARTLHPKVVILDIGMPGLNGYEVAKAIRAEDWGKDALLVAHTAWGREKDKEDALKAGFDLHITKPVEPRALLEIFETSHPAIKGLTDLGSSEQGGTLIP